MRAYRRVHNICMARAVLGDGEVREHLCTHVPHHGRKPGDLWRIRWRRTAKGQRLAWQMPRGALPLDAARSEGPIGTPLETAACPATWTGAAHGTAGIDIRTVKLSESHYRSERLQRCVQAGQPIRGLVCQALSRGIASQPSNQHKVSNPITDSPRSFYSAGAHRLTLPPPAHLPRTDIPLG